MRKNDVCTAHCLKNNLNLRIKTKPVTAETDATVNVWFMGHICVLKSVKYGVASNPAILGSVFMQRFKLGQRIVV